MVSLHQSMIGSVSPHYWGDMSFFCGRGWWQCFEPSGMLNICHQRQLYGGSAALVACTMHACSCGLHCALCCEPSQARGFCFEPSRARCKVIRVSVRLAFCCKYFAQLQSLYKPAMWLCFLALHAWVLPLDGRVSDVCLLCVAMQAEV